MELKVLIISNIKDSAYSKPDIELIYGLKNQGITPDVLIPADSPYVDIFRHSGIRVIPGFSRNKFSLRSILQIRNEIKKEKYKIVHLFNTRAIINGSFAAIGLPVKVIAYRGAAGIYWYDPTSWWAHLNPRIDWIICNSEYVRQHMQKQLLFRPKKAVMIYKGMNVSSFSSVKPFSRKDLGIADHSLIVGCVANMRKIKGLQYLLESSYYLDPELPVHFLLIGSGIDSAANLEIIKSSPFKQNIHLLGFRKDVYELIAACDIYVQPSLSESLCRSVMEAMCLGVPCVVSDAGGLVELIEDNKSGLVVKKGNARGITTAVESLVHNADLRKRFADEALKRMQNIFSVQNMVLNTVQFYKSIVTKL
ncbi:MAG TPA: glycosyltransferase family 4 protein [Bacteroidales bacterium]|nr:glycosyltransferase family 4 protein [Bacteroidales bacterium]